MDMSGVGKEGGVPSGLAPQPEIIVDPLDPDLDMAGVSVRKERRRMYDLEPSFDDSYGDRRFAIRMDLGMDCGHQGFVEAQASF
jgi:hypothetical protein